MPTNSGLELWDLYGMTARPGIGEKGKCQVIVVDHESKAPVESYAYVGIERDPKPPQSKLEVTWAEGGSVRLAKGQNSWTWSHSENAWQGEEPPAEILKAAMLAATVLKHTH